MKYMTMKYLISAICFSWVAPAKGNGNVQRRDDYYYYQHDDYYYPGSNNNGYGQNSQNNGYGYNGGQNNAGGGNDYDYYGEDYYDNTMYGIYDQNDGDNIDNNIYGTYVQNQDLSQYGGAWINGEYRPFCNGENKPSYNYDGSRHHTSQAYMQSHSNFQNYYQNNYGNGANNYGNLQSSNNYAYNNAYNRNNNMNAQNYVTVRYHPSAYAGDDQVNAWGDDEYRFYNLYHEYDFFDGQYVAANQYQNLEEYCIDYTKYTPAQNCRQSIITVKSVDIKCDSPYMWSMQAGGHMNSETCMLGDKARITVFFENAYDLPDQPIYWTIGIYARKQELQLLWSALNVDLCSEMVGHQCTKAGNYAFSFQANLDYGYTDADQFHPVVEMGFSSQADEGYDMGGVNINCKFKNGYHPYDPSYASRHGHAAVWGAGIEVNGLYGLLIGLAILSIALMAFICKQQKGRRWRWKRRKKPLAEDEMYVSPSGSIAEV